MLTINRSRLHPSESAAVFRTMVSSLASPGELFHLPDIKGFEPSALPVLCLADLELALSILCNPGDADPRLVQRLVGARQAPTSQADIVLARRSPTIEEILSLPRGTALSPERGCRLVIECGGFGNGIGLSVTGPGVDGTEYLTVFGVSLDVFTAINLANAKRPCGIDVHLVAPNGTIASLPRSCRARVDSHALATSSGT